MLTEYYQKATKGFQKKLMKRIKTLLKKKNRTNMPVSGIETFLKKKKKRSVNMVINGFLFHRLVKCWKFYEYKKLVTIPIFFLNFFYYLRQVHQVT